MSTNVSGRGRQITVPAPSNVTAGQLVVVGNLHGVAVDDAASGAPVVLTTEAVAVLPFAGSVNIGDYLAWVTDKLVPVASAGENPVVRAIALESTTGTTVLCKLTPALAFGDVTVEGYDPDGVTITLTAGDELQVANPYPGVDDDTIKVEGDVLVAQLPTVPAPDGVTIGLNGSDELEVINPYPAELAYLSTDGPVSVATSTSTGLPLIVGDVVDVDLNAGEPKIEVEGFYAVRFSTLFEAVTGNIECVLMGSTLGIIGDDDADNLTGVPATIGGCCNIWLPANEVLTMSAKHTDAAAVDVTGHIWIKRIG